MSEDKIPYKPKFSKSLLPSAREIIESTKWTKIDRLKRAIYLSNILSFRMGWLPLFTFKEYKINTWDPIYTWKAPFNHIRLTYRLFKHGFKTRPSIVEKIITNRENLLCQENQLDRVTKEYSIDSEAEGIYDKLPCIVKFPDPQLILPKELEEKLDNNKVQK
jgi:hypothetical protein